ncbi:fibronectin type III domain-containing protein, partial [Cohnella fermenti]|uniref:fibronectin type III domain-containing protein n=1 Tax=Cohnella fermenti TaxID=2565925 RepID=UPI001454DF0A
AAVVTNRTITLSWDTVAPDAQYEVEVDGKITDIGTDTTFHHGGLQAEEFHSYKIRWKNAEGTSQWVAVLSLSTLSNPLDGQMQVEAFATNNSIELRWDKVNGATGYDIEIDGDAVVEGTGSSYTHSELSSGTSHMYRVRAKNETGVTAWSDAIVKSTTSPTYQVKATKDKTFSLSIL